ncbi:MAG: guanylate kinase [Minisyncoccota bacterium]
MKNSLVVLIGPSGAGKSTICTKLLERFKHLGAVETVSSTTRPSRVGENDGVHYHFISRGEFKRQDAREEFLESAEYGGNLYGTNRHMLEEMFKRSPLVIAVLEIQGCRQLQKKGVDLLICPIIPDNMAALEPRIRARPGTKEDDVSRRLTKASEELSIIESGEFGPPVINCTGDINGAVDEAQRRIEEYLRR